MQTPSPASYPRHWEADVVLRDGRVAHLRPIQPADADALVAFYDGVSEEARYMRFFAPKPRLTDAEVYHFTHLDHRARVGFAVTTSGRIIAVGRYERLGARDARGRVQAEVAFLVQDAHQGRGISQLLLEHLAQAGRERGIEVFVADALADNQRMMSVFVDSGYTVRRQLEGGIVRMEFPIDSTQTSMDVMQAREHRAEAASIQRFFDARSVAVVGASRRADTIGRTLVRNLVLGDFQGRVYAVNSAAESVAGMPAYKAVSDIPGEVDIAIVAVPADAVREVVIDCAYKGVHGLVIVSAGFAETGEEGRARQRDLVGLARGHGLRLVGPNALGIVNTSADVSLNASLSPVMPPRGRAGFFCQSGALGIAILEKVTRRGLGISTFVSAGNRADVSGNDLLQYWEEDDATEVVLLYLESIGNPRKFSRIARRVSRRKPVIAVKSGRTTQGVPMGHAVRESMVGHIAVDAMFRQAGVIQVDTLDDMFDVAQLVAHQPLPAGNRVAVVGNSDAILLLAADAAAALGLEVTHTSALKTDATGEDFEKALDRAIDDPESDAVVVVFVPPLMSVAPDVADVIAAVGEQSHKPVLTTFLAAEGVPELLRVPDTAGSSAGRGSVPSYESPEAAVRALAKAVEYAAWLATPEGDATRPDGIDTEAAARQVGAILIDSPQGYDLEHEELIELLGSYGIELWPRIAVETEAQAVAAGEELGWDVVLKSTAPLLRQRPDISHVRRHIAGPDQMRESWRALNSWTGGLVSGSFVVQSDAVDGVPLNIGGVEDTLFGPVLSLGLSGFASDLLGDRTYRIPPLHQGDAEAMIKELRAAPMLFGYRGVAPVAIEPIIDIIERLAQLKNDLPQVQRLDLALVLAGAGGARVLTAAGRVEPSLDARSDWFVRRLSSPAGGAG